jgi:N-acetylneuraminic acid mutarotase
MSRLIRAAAVALAALTVLVAPAGAATGAWTTHAPLPEPRSEVAAALVGSEILVVGGFVAGGGNSARVDAYSVLTDDWRRLPDLPVSVDHAAAASVDGRIYVVGGYGRDRAPLRTAFAFEDGAWRRLPPLPDARAAAAAAIVRGRLYVVGGRNGRRGLARDALTLSLGSDRWTTIPGPSPREHLAAAASAGQVYAIGGRVTGIDTNLRTFEVYDAAARRWRRLAPLPGARGGTGAASLGGRIVSVGGEQAGGTIQTVYSYAVGTRRWSRLPDLPTPRHGLGVVAARDQVWVLAGGPEPGLTFSAAVESLKPAR